MLCRESTGKSAIVRRIKYDIFGLRYPTFTLDLDGVQVGDYRDMDILDVGGHH